MSKWAAWKFDEVIYDDTKSGTKIKRESYLDEGQYPIVDQGQELIAGYQNNDDGLYKNVPAIIFGDHTRIIKYVDFPFFLGADGVKVLKAKFKEIDYKYLYYFFVKNEVPNTGYNRHFKWLKELKITIPPLEIQKQIAKNLDIASELLAMRKQQLAELNNLIKSIFYDMFGDPIANDKGWDLVPFTDVVILQRGFDLPVQNRARDGKIPVCGSNGVLDYHNYAKVKNGGVITGRSGTIGKVYYTLEDYWPLNTTLFSVDIKGNNIIYLANLLQFFDLSRFSSGTGVPTLNRNIVHKEKIFNVPYKKQVEFATIVTKIEEQKSLVQKAIDETQLLFDSLMSQYFDQ